jgi:hypothetical protein
MARRKGRIAVVGVLWLLWIGLLLTIIFLYTVYNDGVLANRSQMPFLSRYRMGYPHTGFPYMPLYGAVTWWFFFAIPLIGWTWGVFNDLKDKGLDARYDRYRADAERERADLEM